MSLEGLATAAVIIGFGWGNGQTGPVQGTVSSRDIDTNVRAHCGSSAARRPPHVNARVTGQERRKSREKIPIDWLRGLSPVGNRSDDGCVCTGLEGQWEKNTFKCKKQQQQQQKHAVKYFLSLTRKTLAQKPYLHTVCQLQASSQSLSDH